jgi:hypothetical protein
MLKVIGGGSANEDPKIICTDMRLPEELMAESKEDLIDFCFGQRVFKEPFNPSSLKQIGGSALLSPKNEAVAAINDIALNNLVGDVRVYKSIDSPIDSANPQTKRSANRLQLNIDSLNRETPTGMPPHLLKLKVLCLYYDDKPIQIV